MELKVSRDGEVKTDSDTLSFYVEEGMTEFAEAYEQVRSKLEEVEDAVIELATETGVDLDDFLQRLCDAFQALEEAEDVADFEEIYKEAVAITKEFEARLSEWEASTAPQPQPAPQPAPQPQPQPQPNRAAEIEACKQAMFDYAWNNMVTTPFFAEPVRLEGFWMNNSCTEAGATMVGMKTAHTDPENAGDMV